MSNPYQQHQPMYVQPAPNAGKSSKPGKGLLIASAVLFGIAIVLVVVGTIFGFNRIAESELFRSIALDSPTPYADIPGQVQFRVIEPLNNDPASMRIGVGLPRGFDRNAECVLSTLAGDEILMNRGQPGDVFVNYDDLTSETLEEWTVIGVATLEPGAYSMRCDREDPDDNLAGSADEFYVGRVFGQDEAMEFIGPVLIWIATWGGAFILGVLAIIFLIVGLVRWSKHNRSQQPPFPPQGPGPQAPYPPQGPGPQGLYPPQGPGPQQGQPSGPPPWPAPHAPGPVPVDQPPSPPTPSPPTPDSGQYSPPDSQERAPWQDPPGDGWTTPSQK